MSDKKTRPDSKIGTLPREVQERVFAKCENIKLEEGCEWLLKELDIKLSKARLGKWLTKERAERKFEALLEKLAKASNLAQRISKAAGGAAKFTEASVTMLGQKLFELLCAVGDRPNENLRGQIAAQFAMVLKALATTKALGLKREHLALDLKKFKAAYRTKMETGLKELANEIQANPRALAIYEQLEEELAKEP